MEALAFSRGRAPPVEVSIYCSPLLIGGSVVRAGSTGRCDPGRRAVQIFPLVPADVCEVVSVVSADPPGQACAKSLAPSEQMARRGERKPSEQTNHC